MEGEAEGDRSPTSSVEEEGDEQLEEFRDADWKSPKKAGNQIKDTVAPDTNKWNELRRERLKPLKDNEEDSDTAKKIDFRPLEDVRESRLATPGDPSAQIDSYRSKPQFDPQSKRAGQMSALQSSFSVTPQNSMKIFTNPKFQRSSNWRQSNLQNPISSVPVRKEHSTANVNISQYSQSKLKVYPNPGANDSTMSLDPRKEDIAKKLLRINDFER